MTTGASLTASPAFHTEHADQIVPYRSLCVAAIVGLVLGLASPLCFGAMLLNVIPVAGIAISIYALRSIAASDGTLAGRWAAVTGLFLCTAMLVAPLARSAVIRHYRTAQAQGFAERWLKLAVAGEVDEAFRLTSDSTRNASPFDPAAGPSPPTPREKFLALPIVKSLSAAGSNSVIRYVDTDRYDAEAFPRVYVRQHFQVTPAAQGDAKPIDAWLTLQRSRLPQEGRARWVVWSVDDVLKPDSSAAPY